MSDSEPKSPLPVHSLEKPQRKSPSTRRYCLWIAGLAACAISGCILPSIVTSVQTAYRRAAYPHESLYQNQTLSEVSNRSLVIQPLINKEQTFDVAVSVWVRRTIDEELEWKESQRDLFDFEFYRPLFSDVVFRGLRLSDKGKYASINFTLPTERFRKGTIEATTLIGTFLLIPTSPSLMDFVVDYSSYIPERVLSKFSPVRTWPFPMGSEYKGEKTLVDTALESFSLRIPLIRFHDIPSRCQGVGANDTSKHPHITTWSQLRIVDETHIMNLEAYNQAHEKLKQISCGRESGGKPGDAQTRRSSLRRYCQESFWETGNLQTRLELKMKDPEHTEWAYAPYMTFFLHASGPQDLVPVSVHLQDCPGEPALETSQNTSTFDLIGIFSGRTPAKLWALGGPGHTVNHSQSDYDKVIEQDFAELANGIQGVRKPDTHPRRRVFLAYIDLALGGITTVLEYLYWFTRSNTVSISIPGTLFLAVHQCLQVLMAWMAVLLPSHTPSSKWTQAMFYLAYLPLIYRMFRTVLRFESVWKGWIPTFRKRGASHSERTSERLDATTSWRVRLSLLCILFLVFYFVEDHLVLLPALHPPRPKESSSALLYWFRDLLYDIDRCFWITGLLSQLILNTKSERFAGNFKLAAFLIWLKETLQLLSFVPAVVGRVKTRPALLWPETLLWCVETVLVYQAVTLPAVGPVRLDDDEQ
ncbi:hypothetical protein D9758_008145 [Tetrapyrgos nigripes]|uniref:Uncharacterized protein n=1 Tax=Tetrapyrgos nigripes TaxID=182062 RepID=A0A8H5LP94_9AGAR|nr:hypothetical protein D9758_008145 [Tetrapyrgos nigripes]